MANELKWSALGTYTTAIAGSGVAPTLKALASAGQKIGNEIDNATTVRGRYISIDLLCRFAVAPAAGAWVSIYLVPAVDGTNYTNGSDSVAPPSTALLCVLPVLAVATAQRTSALSLPCPPYKFKPLLVNDAGQALTNTDAENVLSYRIHNEELQ